MFILTLGRHRLWSGPDGTWYYYDEAIWIAAAIALAWLAWFFVRSYLRARALKRRPRGVNRRLLKRTARIKSELSSQYMLPGFSANIHAVGIGRLGSGEYCIQVFLNDANAELWNGSGTAPLPISYRGIPVVRIEMPIAVFLSDASLGSVANWDQYPNGIRERQEVIVGGISGANTNLTGQSGTIGYFCTRKSKLPRRKEIHMLSNSHVFADLRKAKVDDGDLIMQPSPGEPANNRPIGALVNFSALKFDSDINQPNHVDAAIAKLWEPFPHKPVIPLIGEVKGYVAKNDVEIGETARKFGRTTGYTEGTVYSIYLDIWIRYDRTGQSAFFKDQFLIGPTLPDFRKFVSKGDSGSLVVDQEQHAIGLIFAGMSELPLTVDSPREPSRAADEPVTNELKRIENYGVANPISEVLSRLKIELLV